VGADPELPAQNNGNAFAFAIKIGKPEMLVLLLEQRPVETLSAKAEEYLMFNSVLVWLAGWIMAIPFVGACAQRDPRLKSPADYFASAQTIALLQAALAGDLDKSKILSRRGRTQR
jgi:hypothetical protein